MTLEEQAWCAAAWCDGDSQPEIARQTNRSVSHICSAIRAFCEENGGRTKYLYDDARRDLAAHLLQKYLAAGGRLSRPPQMYPVHSHVWARREHAWLLHTEGLTYNQIGVHLGVSGNRAHQIVHRFSRRVGRAIRLTRWRIVS